MNAASIIQLAYGIPGVVAYFVAIYAMRTLRKDLSRSFITIFTVTSIINIATWFNSWLSIRLKLEPSFISIHEWVVEFDFIRHF
ncbi:hypothetical protein PRIPAC_84896 [Pristionchus pacificus]|uniref:Serpentine receptor class gamma n=1 Tax=Pristionchus pacificus TaxID=54126 RepID=A0A2A6BS97_PRIPA|nr:hypothetical protein PRIPAC_84896 [Pristionchus pacificus]|eukprot:PDM68673.1 G protein-coupled receptor [Pristionchus pacificus]